MRITSWNVNSVRARLHRIPEWLDEARPDVLCLQELKCMEEQFPREIFESRGYHLAIRGQKTYNGVAIASRLPLEDVDTDLPVAGDSEARGIAATIGGIRVVNLYVVNGKAVGDVKYEWKLQWLDALVAYVKGNYRPDQALVVCGDYNIAPTDEDTWDPELWHEKVLCSEPERARLQQLLDWGLVDSYRALYPEAWGRYAHTWWDYRGRGFQRGLGMRIDHHLVTRSVMERTSAVEIDRNARKGEKPSDHAPVTLVLDAE
jgi:exodeoxyribonuclease-3